MDVYVVFLAGVVGLLAGLLLGYLLLRVRIAATADALLAAWKMEEEARIRADAEQRSRAVLSGRISEQLAPMRLDCPFNPSDARFLGSPVDFIVFDGYTDVRDGKATVLREIVFVDIKTGGSRLTPVERRLKVCVEEGRVRWELLDITAKVPASA